MSHPAFDAVATADVYFPPLRRARGPVRWGGARGGGRPSECALQPLCSLPYPFRPKWPCTLRALRVYCARRGIHARVLVTPSSAARTFGTGHSSQHGLHAAHGTQVGVEVWMCGCRKVVAVSLLHSLSVVASPRLPIALGNSMPNYTQYNAPWHPHGVQNTLGTR